MSEPVYLLSEKKLIEYIKNQLKEHDISQEQIAKEMKTHQSTISRLLSEKRDDSRLFKNIRYSEAHEMVSTIQNITSPFPNKHLSEIYTSSAKVEEVGIVYSDEKVEEAAKRMQNNKFTQLLVKNRKNNECIGIVTDYVLLRRMLFPREVSKDWLNTFKEKEIIKTGLVDKVPTYPLGSSLVEVAEGLMHHYAVLIEEENGKYGVITRADFLKVLDDDLIEKSYTDSG